MRSRGAVEFKARLPQPAIHLAERFGVSASAISAWRKGTRVPGQDSRQAIYEAGGPEPRAWDEPAPAAPRQVPRATGDARATPEGVRSLADQQYAQALQLTAELEAASNEAMSDRVRLLEKLASITTSLGRQTGAAILNERQILSAPAWLTVERALKSAFDGWEPGRKAEALRLMWAALDPLRQDPQ